MSFYNDYVVASNNSDNENNINAKKARSSTKHQLKQLIKPILAIIKKNKNNTYKKTQQPDYYEDCESADNAANELLEARLFEEIESCDDFSAVPVYSNGTMDIVPVFRGQKYIPVHFAKTEAGTFFWTSMMGPDADICYNKSASEHQQPELQVASDRWAQA